MTTIRIDTGPLDRLTTAMMNTSTPAFKAMFRQWAARYSSKVRRRFSAGGGPDVTWAPLKPSTVASRRGPESSRRAKRGRRDLRSAKTTTRGGAGTVTILVDTATLRNASSIGAPGNLTRPIRDGVRYGFKGSRHSGGITLATLAEAHQNGVPKNNLPARPILFDPNVYPDLVRGMVLDLRRAIERTAR